MRQLASPLQRRGVFYAKASETRSKRGQIYKLYGVSDG
jgi:hypothetical protein